MAAGFEFSEAQTSAQNLFITQFLKSQKTAFKASYKLSQMDCLVPSGKHDTLSRILRGVSGLPREPFGLQHNKAL